MAQDTNIHTIVGNLTADVTTKSYEKNGDPQGGTIAEFRVAVNRRPPRGGGESKADFFTVKAFDGLAQTCAQYLSKGKKVLVSGRHQIDEVDRRDGNGKAYFPQIIADTVQFLTPAGDNAGGGGQQAVAPAASQASDADIPF